MAVSGQHIIVNFSLSFNHDTECVAVAIEIARLIIMINLDGRLCCQHASRILMTKFSKIFIALLMKICSNCT